jgi:hypothetical protein
VKVAMHQSQYLPWPPLIRKINLVDHFVVMDSVQFQKNGVQNRNQIRNAQGAFWLTIPVTGGLDTTIAEKPVVDQRWRDKHWKSLEACYRRAPHWSTVGERLMLLYEHEYLTLGHVNGAFLVELLDLCGVSTPVTRLSRLHAEGAKSALVLDVCQRLGATVYRSGVGARDYLDVDAFAAAGIEVEFDDSEPPEYDQGYRDFIKGLSVVDYLMHADPDEIADYLEPTDE